MKTRRLALNRKGDLGIQDLVVLLFFVIMAVLLYAFLFYPIVEKHKIQATYNTQTVSTTLASDAQYTAYALLAHKALPGTSENEQQTLRRAITILIEDYDKQLQEKTDEDDREEWLAERVDGSSYAATLDSVFGSDSDYWSASISNTARVTIILKQGNTYLQGTCREYSNPNTRDDSMWACAQLGNTDALTIIDPDTQQSYRNPGVIQDTRTTNFGQPQPLQNRATEIGVVHVPTSSGPVTMLVYLLGAKQ